MKFTKEEVQKCARYMRAYLKDNGTFGLLDEQDNQTQIIPAHSGERIVTLPWHHHSVRSYTICYVKGKTSPQNVPLQVEVSELKNSSVITAKCLQGIEGYRSHRTDDFGNTHQIKELSSVSIPEIVSELELLAGIQ